MARFPFHLERADVLVRRDVPPYYGIPCSGGTWDCLNTPTQFGIIFSVVIVAVVIASTFWYAIIRPRQERIKESGEDIELDLGDGRTVVVSSGPHQRTVVFRGHRSPTPPLPAYRPPTPGGRFASTIESSQPSPRESTVKIWPPPQSPPPPPPHRPHTPQQILPQPTITPSIVQGHPLPGSYPQPMPVTMQPPQMMVPGPPPPPPAILYPRAQPQMYFVIPPPPPPPPQPPPAPVLPAQGMIPPPPHPPPPPPPPLSQPVSTGFYPKPSTSISRVRSRPPSPGHASTIEDSDSDRGGSLPPTNRRGRSPARGRSPPPGGSHFTRSRSPSPSERRQQHARRHQHHNPSRSPPHGRQRERAGQGNQCDCHIPQQDGPSSDSRKSSGTSYRSSTSLDSELRTDLASLLTEAGARQRARETERLQALVDRYDREEEEERAHRTDSETGHGRYNLPRLPGQPIRHGNHQAETAETVEAAVAHRGDEAYGTGNEEGNSQRPRRRVAFHEPTSVVVESRVGRPPRRSESPPRVPTREDLHHGESRVGRRRRTPSPDERAVQRRVTSAPSAAESRIGKPQPSSPPTDHPTRRRHSHRFTDVGESRVVGTHQGRRRRKTHPAEAFPSGRGPNYYNTHDDAHSGYLTTHDGLLFNEARSEGPPSSAGATCATGSQASSDSNDQRRRMGLTPSKLNRNRSHHGHEEARPRLRSPSMERAGDDRHEEKSLKSSWGSKLASFLPTIVRLATKNKVVREVADNIADEVRTHDRRDQGDDEWRKLSAGHRPHDNQQTHPQRPPHHFSGHHQRRDARRPHSQDSRQGASQQQRSSHDRYRSHRRRPSTIHEEPHESLQVALEHAAERLAEEVVDSAMDRAHRGGGGQGDQADVMPGQDNQRRRRPRRNRETEP